MNAGIDYAIMVPHRREWLNAAFSGAYRDEWVKGINSELDSLETHDTLTVVPITHGTRDLPTISSRMILQEKLGEDRRVAPFKALLVAHGVRECPVLVSSKPNI